MPKKSSSWGMQEYVPAGNGDPSGEYADDSGSNVNYKFDPENFGRGKGQQPKSEKKKGGIQVTDGGGKYNGSFIDYLKNNFKTSNSDVTAENLEKQFNVGSDDAKSIINALISNGYNVHVSRDGSDFFRRGSGVFFSKEAVGKTLFKRNEGEIFYHELSHAMDDWLSYDVPQEEVDEASQSFISARSKYGISQDSVWCRSYATATKKLSNGKTLYQTLVQETKTHPKYYKIVEDFNNDVNERVKKELGSSLTEIEKKQEELYSLLKKKVEAEGLKSYQDSFWERVQELKKSDDEYKAIKEKAKKADSIKREVGKDWVGISDTCEGSGYYAFHGGHGSSYWKTRWNGRGTKLHRGAEFIAEYCSAYARKNTNGKKELELFEKYFPETSKCARELFEMALKKTKGEKA